MSDYSILASQDFPLVLRTWGALKNLMRGRGGLKSIHGESMGGLKMLLKNTCEGVCLLVKLPAISLKACKIIKNELHTYF